MKLPDQQPNPRSRKIPKGERITDFDSFDLGMPSISNGIEWAFQGGRLSASGAQFSVDPHNDVCNQLREVPQGETSPVDDEGGTITRFPDGSALIISKKLGIIMIDARPTFQFPGALPVPSQPNYEQL